MGSKIWNRWCQISVDEKKLVKVTKIWNPPTGWAEGLIKTVIAAFDIMGRPSKVLRLYGDIYFGLGSQFDYLVVPKSMIGGTKVGHTYTKGYLKFSATCKTPSEWGWEVPEIKVSSRHFTENVKSVKGGAVEVKLDGY
jgi:hypothetical protein